MAYSVTQLKDFTSVPAVANWSDAKITLFQTMAETVLNSLDMDSTVAGYTDAYSAATVLIFDWLANNPTSLQSYSAGKVSKSFIMDSIPAGVRSMLSKYIEGESGTLSGAILEREDIGRR